MGSSLLKSLREDWAHSIIRCSPKNIRWTDLSLQARCAGVHVMQTTFISIFPGKYIFFLRWATTKKKEYTGLIMSQDVYICGIYFFSTGMWEATPDWQETKSILNVSMKKFLGCVPAEPLGQASHLSCCMFCLFLGFFSGDFCLKSLYLLRGNHFISR